MKRTAITVHSQLDDIGLESTELSGKQRAQFRGLLNKIATSDVKTRLDALPDFVTYIAEPAIEAGRGFRPQAQGISQNKEQYKLEIAEEAARDTEAALHRIRSRKFTCHSRQCSK